jgi:hypothetical protein
MTSKRRRQRQRGKMRTEIAASIKLGLQQAINYVEINAPNAAAREAIDKADEITRPRQMKLAEEIMLEDRDVLRSLTK